MTAPVTRDAIIAALSTDANEGRTAREISEQIGLKYSTVTEGLRTLAEEGVARKEKSGRQVTWTKVAADDQQQPADPAPADDDAPLADVVPIRRDASATGAVVVDEVADVSGPVPVRTDDAPSDTAADASDALDLDDTTPDAGSAATVDLTPVVVGSEVLGGAPAAPVDLTAATSITDVAAFMEQQRPIPEAPAKPEKATRAPRASAPAREVRNDFGSGGLQGEVLRYMDEHRADDGTYLEFGPYSLATALSAHASSVAYSLKRTTAKGQTIQTNGPGEKPRFRLATAEEYAAHQERTAAAKAADAS